ncbi:type II secretion system F family protein [Streptomyces sp. XM4193]|uniref:type II secretion system F family protein n=1 Tax=Streptomyces sp. XM4193 TaxID=2929782 RepID=UPI001FF7AD9E|nr:type II secretion system F family protein [Streptomyces sp. XM4193]MCK1795131.1 type II secretion system F family protein [Streptomyces sp. XM4193]
MPGGLVLCLVVVAVGCALAHWQRSPLPLLGCLGAAVAVRRGLRSRARRLEADRREAAVVELCVEVAAELRAASQPQQALLAVGVAGLGPPGAAVLAAARFGGDLPGALRSAAGEPGGGGLGGVAACWQVAAEGGSGLAAGLDRVAHALRLERDQREDLQAQLAGPRATVSILAGLPLLGVSMGTAMGADPLGVLLHTPVGWVLLAASSGLELLGALWARAIVRRAAGARDREEAR